MSAARTVCRLPRITAAILKKQQLRGLHSPATFDSYTKFQPLSKFMPRFFQKAKLIAVTLYLTHTIDIV